MKIRSPLRYPGGKARLFGQVKSVLEQNDLIGCAYAEPYAGGAGLALQLLSEECVSHIHINDWDKAIWGFWNAVLNETTDLIEWLSTVPATPLEWERQKSIVDDEQRTSFERGCAAFFLNRVNRSGIITGGLIGGREQSGKYQMDCRFNRANLQKRIEWIAEQKSNISLYNQDAIDFFMRMDKTLPKKSILYIDPPYYKQGASLYTNAYNKSDHQDISKIVKNLKSNWFMTYDNVPEIFELYEGCTRETFSLQYSLNQKKKAKELFIAPKGLKTSSFLSAEKSCELLKN